MANNSAQGSITIKRLRTGGSLFITFGLNDKPLFQNVDKESGAVTPDWSKAENQPVITPVVTSSLGNTVLLNNHTWLYEGVTLAFTGASRDDGFVTDTSGRFAMDPSTGALRILKNLASKDNIASDIFKYQVKANVAGVEYSIEKEIELLIQQMGSSSYVGYVLTSTAQLTSVTPTATLTTKLYSQGNERTDYYVKWYKDNEELVLLRGNKSITVGQSDVNGSQLFVAEFYESSGSTSPIARYGIHIIDTKDIYQIQLSITSDNKDVDKDKAVTVVAKVVNTTQNTVVSLPDTAAWRIDLMDGDTWEVIKTVYLDNVTITTDDTDVDATDTTPAKLRDVEVVAEVSW